MAPKHSGVALLFSFFLFLPRFSRRDFIWKHFDDPRKGKFNLLVLTDPPSLPPSGRSASGNVWQLSNKTFNFFLFSIFNTCAVQFFDEWDFCGSTKTVFNLTFCNLFLLLLLEVQIPSRLGFWSPKKTQLSAKVLLKQSKKQSIIFDSALAGRPLGPFTSHNSQNGDRFLGPSRLCLGSSFLYFPSRFISDAVPKLLMEKWPKYLLFHRLTLYTFTFPIPFLLFKKSMKGTPFWGESFLKNLFLLSLFYFKLFAFLEFNLSGIRTVLDFTW